MHIGEKIRKIRVLKGLSQEYLANQIGVSQNSLSKIELGETKISEKRLHQISIVLELHPNEIINFNEALIFKNDNSISENVKLTNRINSHEELLLSYKEQISLLREQCEILKDILRKNKIIS